MSKVQGSSRVYQRLRNEYRYLFPTVSVIIVLTRCTACIDDDQDPRHSVPNQASHGEPDYVDGSGLIFSMYLERAEEEDKKMVENWKADADGILIFVRLHFQTLFLVSATH